MHAKVDFLYVLSRFPTQHQGGHTDVWEISRQQVQRHFSSNKNALHDVPGIQNHLGTVFYFSPVCQLIRNYNCLCCLFIINNFYMESKRPLLQIKQPLEQLWLVKVFFFANFNAYVKCTSLPENNQNNIWYFNGKQEVGHPIVATQVKTLGQKHVSRTFCFKSNIKIKC